MKIIANIELKRYFIFLALFFCLSLRAQEPLIMTLEAIYSNDSYLFRYKQSRTLCEPYGVWTLERALRRNDIDKTCKKRLQEFVLHNPKLQYLAYYILHIEQGYRVEFKKGGECVVYHGSKRTLSETLLLAGAAVEKPRFANEEFRYRFYQAQRAAKVNKRGIWSDEKMQSCLSEFFKE